MYGVSIQSLQCCMQYRVILGRVITAPDCILACTWVPRDVFITNKSSTISTIQRDTLINKHTPTPIHDAVFLLLERKTWLTSTIDTMALNVGKQGTVTARAPKQRVCKTTSLFIEDSMHMITIGLSTSTVYDFKVDLMTTNDMVAARLTVLGC